ncbi:MAG: hypothetical protein ACLFR0_08010 [Alphaproteobacteria bacterium]
MLFTAFKIGVSACVIAFASWLSGKRPDLAGFIIALPLVTLLALPFSYAEYQNAENSVAFAKSIMLAVPLSLTFFLPFLFAKYIIPVIPQDITFWVLYGSGLICLIGAYFAHQYLIKLFN